MNYFFVYLYWFLIIMIIFFFLKHPLVMGLMLILNTFFLSLFIMVFSYSSWNSYILFLLFLSGILILFLYNISLISTEMFFFINYKEIIYLLIFIFIFISFYFKESYFNDKISFFYFKDISPMMYMYMNMNLNTIFFLMVYLFLSLICIVNLIYLMKDKGSMRI